MRHLLTPPAALRDLALLATRLLLGTVLITRWLGLYRPSAGEANA